MLCTSFSVVLRRDYTLNVYGEKKMYKNSHFSIDILKLI